ncbi:MAG: hypothetical protein AB7S75_14090 [Desulfococcaceae bacterium]
MQNPFTEEQISQLSEEMERQLDELGTLSFTHSKKGGDTLPELPKKQIDAIEAATGEKPLTFIKKFKKAARKDLCEEGGVQYAQWKKWQDLTNDAVLKQFGAVLVGMGLAGNPLQVTAVALGVMVIHIGLKAFCMEDKA